MARRNLLLAFSLLTMAALACGPFGGGDGATDTPSAPNVHIIAPEDGAEVTVGQEVLFQVTATDTYGVTRVDILINGMTVSSYPSQDPAGQITFTVLYTWSPVATGTYQVEAIAYRGEIAGRPDSITINVVEGEVSEPEATALVPTGVATANPYICEALVNVDGSRVRVGPGAPSLGGPDYAIIDVMQAGETAEVIGRLGDNSWWRITYVDPAAGRLTGWIWSGLVTLRGDCSGVPVAPVPPTPVPPAPTETPTIPPPTPETPNAPPPQPTSVLLPDLAVIQIDAPGQLVLQEGGSRITVTITVKNVGQAATGPFDVAFYPVGPGGDRLVLPRVENLDPGQVTSLPVDWTYTAHGVYRLTAEVDCNLMVGESDEGNNVLTFDMAVVPPSETPTPTNTPSEDS